MKKFIFTQENGVVAIVYPAAKSDLERLFGPMTDEQYEQHVWERTLSQRPDAVNPRYIEDAEIPGDETFRDAWVDGGDQAGIVVDMPKAREIHMARIRHTRNVKLKELDIETMKGRDVQSEKQVLRDLPQTFDLSVAQTPEQLKELWPEVLK